MTRDANRRAQRIGNVHVVVNMLCLLTMVALTGVFLWLLVLPFWVWLGIYVPAALGVAYVANRMCPWVTGPFIDYWFGDMSDPATPRLTKRPVDQRELMTSLLGLLLFGYASVDSIITDSMPGYWRDGFFRVVRAEEPVSFWIYRILCIAGAAFSVWAVVYLLTADRWKRDADS